MYRSISVMVAVIALAVAASPAGAAHPDNAVLPPWTLAVEQACPGHFEGISYYRRETWRYERRMSARITTATYAEHRVKSCDEVVPFVARWRNLANQRAKQYRLFLKRQASLPWAFWKCVATGIYPGRGRVSVGEGGATSYNPAGYYGRYQMDWGFMRNHGADMLKKYGGKDARSWSVYDQTVVAERGFRVQGPYAWPNTAPPCMGLR